MLFNYAEKWGSICTESDCATVRDEICLRIDQSQFTADEAEDYINQEVEKRIAERMPSEEEIMRRVRNRKDYLRELGYPTQVLVKYGDAIIETIEWLRSRLTCSEKPNNSQKTEGGGGCR